MGGIYYRPYYLHYIVTESQYKDLRLSPLFFNSRFLDNRVLYILIILQKINEHIGLLMPILSSEGRVVGSTK